MMPLGHADSLPAGEAPSRDLAFSIVGFRVIEAGKLRAAFTVAVRGLGQIDALLFDGKRGPFVSPASLKDDRGAYRSVVSFTRDFAESVCRAALALLDRHQKPSFVEAPLAPRRTSALARSKRTSTRRRSIASDRAEAFLAAQERAFDDASRDFGDEGHSR